MNTTCIALTVGPIYQTFAQAKRTRAIWASSYFFSYLTRSIVEKALDKEIEVLLPYTHDQKGEKDIRKSQFGEGLYADRVYFEDSNNVSVSKIQDIVKEVIEELAGKMELQECGSKYLGEYLNIHVGQVEVKDRKELLKSINGRLDQLELMTSLPFDDEKNYLQDFVNRTLTDEINFLAEDAFGKSSGRRFRSLAEIATTGLSRLQPEDYKKVVKQSFTTRNEDFELVDHILNTQLYPDLKENFRPYMKYYAVMYADGDNISKVLQATGNRSLELQQLSKELLNFGSKAARLIDAYGGNAIYLGGEDIMAFLPIACVGEQDPELRSLFSLIADLDTAFEETVSRYAGELGCQLLPTMSYGLSLHYVKYPLREAMKKAYSMLETVKTGVDEKGKLFPNKNAIGFSLQKHSGHTFKAFFEKGKEHETSYNCLKDLDRWQRASEDLMTGVVHRLSDPLFYEVFFQALFRGCLEPFLRNNFNEGVHRRDDNTLNPFLSSLLKFSEAVYQDYQDRTKTNQVLFTALRYLHFIQSKQD